MALKSSVLACLILALCMGCNNVMAQNTDLKETEKSGFIIPRSENLGKETEKSGFWEECYLYQMSGEFWRISCPKLEEDYPFFVCLASVLSCKIDEAKPSARVTCTTFILCKKEEHPTGFIIPRSKNLGKETEKSGFIIPRSENLGKETEKSGFIIPRSENLGKETLKSDDSKCWIKRESWRGWDVSCDPPRSFFMPAGVSLHCEIVRETCLNCTTWLKREKDTNKTGFIIPRSENLGKETEKSGNIIP